VTVFTFNYVLRRYFARKTHGFGFIFIFKNLPKTVIFEQSTTVSKYKLDTAKDP